MIEYEISRPYKKGHLDRINSSVRAAIDELGLNGLIHQLLIPKTQRALVTKPGAVSKLIQKTGLEIQSVGRVVSSARDSELINGKVIFQRDWRINRQNTRSGTTASESDISILENVDEHMFPLATPLVNTASICVDVNSKLIYPTARVRRLYDSCELGGEILRRRPPSMPVAWYLPEFANDSEGKAHIAEFKHYIEQNVEKVILGAVAMVPIEVSCEEPA